MTTLVARKRIAATIRTRVPHGVEVRRGPGGKVEMIEFTEYRPNPLAPEMLVNKVGSIIRLPEGIIKVTYVLERPSPGGIIECIERMSTLWPEGSWPAATDSVHWAVTEFMRGTFRGAVPNDGGGRRPRTQ